MNTTTPKSYFIVASNGAMDGFYPYRADADEMLAYFRETFPAVGFFLAEVDSTQKAQIPEPCRARKLALLRSAP